LLEAYHENPIPECHREPLAPVEIEGQEEFEVQEVLDSKSFVESSCTLSFGKVILLLKLLGSLLET
jgi:hypothetical protein